jgi:high affinity sulfate transporter 1
MWPVLKRTRADSRDAAVQGQTADGPSPFRRAEPRPLLTRTLPVTAELAEYRPPTAGRDILAGVTVAALALPAAMAYAELAGLSPVNGLYALVLPTVAYLLLGSSRQVIVGPEGSIVTLVAAAVLPLAVSGSDHAAQLAAMLALLVGVCFFLARVARIAWVGDYFSRPVLVGYIHGVAVVLLIAQLSKLFGVPIPARQPIRQLVEFVREIPNVSGITLAVSAAALTCLMVFRVWLPRLPAALLVVLASIGISWTVDLAAHGVAIVGPVPAGLPSFVVPSASFTEIGQLVPAALAIFLVAFADEILTARSFAGRHNQHVRASQELVAMGAADIAAAFTQGFPIGASGSRTAVNDSMGARTQISGGVAAGVVVLVLLFLTRPIQYLPKPVLAAVIVSAAIGLIDLEAWRQLARVDAVELTLAAVTMAGVIILGVLNALVIAVGLSIVDTVRRSARPSDAVLGWVPRLKRYGDVSLHRSARTTPGVVVYRLDDRIFFANARYFKGRVHEAIRGAAQPVHWLIFDAEAVTHADSTGLEAFERLWGELEGEHVHLAVARLRTYMLERFDTIGLVRAIGPEHFYPSVRTAVEGCVSEMSARGEAADPGS